MTAGSRGEHLARYHVHAVPSWNCPVLMCQSFRHERVDDRSVVCNDIHVGCTRRRALDRIVKRGGRVHATLFCPHDPNLGCECRKPGPRMVIQVTHERGMSLPRSVLIGDAVTSGQLTTAAGVRYIRVASGLGLRDLQANRSIDPGVLVVPNLADAVPLCTAILRLATESATRPKGAQASTSPDVSPVPESASGQARGDAYR
jgi:hypothetical protein